MGNARAKHYRFDYEKIDLSGCDVKTISLIVDEKNLRERLSQDIVKGIRAEDVIERSISRIPLYQDLNTIKIDTSNKSVAIIVSEIMKL